MPRYYITEPHPTISQNSYTHSGRGGAGNIYRAPETTSAAGVATAPQSAPSGSTRFYSGRGGAGNAHSASERNVMSFEDEYGSAVAREKASMGHVGRGGAGNVFGEKTSKLAKSDAGSSRRDSSSTNGSVRSGFWGRLSGSSLGHHKD